MSDQHIVKEVVNFTMLDYATDKPVLFSDYAMVTTNDNKATRIEVRGGQGNYLLGTIDHTKTSTMNLTLPLVDMKLIAMLNGDDLAPAVAEVMQRDALTVQSTYQGTINVTSAATASGNVTVTLDGAAQTVAVSSGDTASQVASEIQAVLNAVTGYSASVVGSTITIVSTNPSNAMTLTYTAGTTGATATANVATANGIVLKKAPIGGTLHLYDLVNERDYGDEIIAGTPATTVNTYSVSGQQVTLNSTSHPSGSEVVAIYHFNTNSKAKKVQIKANKFPKTVKIFGDGVWFDQVNEEVVGVKVQVYRAKPKTDITFTMEGTKATELQVVLDLIPVDTPEGDKAFMEYVILEDE